MKKIIIQTSWLVVTFSIRFSSSSSMCLHFSCLHPWIKKNWDLILDDCILNLNTQLLLKELVNQNCFVKVFSNWHLSSVETINYQQPICNCQVTNLHLEETTWNDLSTTTIYQAQWIYSQATKTKQYPKPDSQNQ